jgi:hypothetical protein
VSYLSVAMMSGALVLLTITPSLGQRAGEGSDKGARKEACRSEARLIYSGSGADREQKKLWRKSAIKDCMQRSSGGGSPGTASSEGSNKEARREACRTQAKVAYPGSGGAELQQRKAHRKSYVKSCMQNGRPA